MKSIYRVTLLLLAVCGLQFTARSQDAAALIKKVKARLDKVNDYTATGSMQTDVVFINAPIG